MATSDDSRIYQDLMRLKPEELSPNAWAVKAGVSRTVWNDMRRHGNPSRRTLEKLLSVVGSSIAEFEALRVVEVDRSSGTASALVGEGARRGWRAAQLPPLPLAHSRLEGEWGEPGSAIELMEVRTDQRVDLLPRPTALASDSKAFAITIVGDSMWPRFRPGRRVAVSPAAPVAVGDDVLVRLRGAEGQALLKELVRRTGAFVELRQFNPDRTFSVDSSQVEAIEKVVGELI